MRLLTYLQICFFCLFPLSLMAEEEFLVRLCAESDTSYYTSFKTALSQANKLDSATLQLLGDVRFDGQASAQSVKTNLTLDLNGYSMGDTLTGTSLLSLAVDTLHLHVFSSRPGGCLWCTRSHDGRINAVQCTKGQLTLDHLTIEVTNTSDTLLKASACGVSVGKEAALSMSHCAVRASARINVYGVNTYTAATIERCVMEVQADSTSAFGVYVNLDTAVLFPPQAQVAHTVLRVKAMQKAYGISTVGAVRLAHDSVYAQTVLNDSYAYYSSKSSSRGDVSHCLFLSLAGTVTCHGAYVYRGALTAEDCRFDGVSRLEGMQELTGTTTRGVSGGTDASLVLRRCLISAQTMNIPMTKGVTGVYGSASTRLVLDSCDIRVEGNETTYGVNAGGRMDIDRCSVSVQAAGGMAYGISITTYFDELLQQDATALIRRTKVSLSAPEKGYAVYTRSPVVLDRDTVRAISTVQDGSGMFALYAFATARVRMTDCDLYAQSAESPRAFYAAGNSTSLSVIACRRSHMSARGENKAYGIYLTGTGVLDSCRIESSSSAGDAYALYAATGCDTVMVSGCYIKVESPAKAFPLNANPNTRGKLWLYGGCYSTDTVIRNYMPDGYCVYRLHDGPDWEAGYLYAIRPIANPGVVVAKVYNNVTKNLLGEFTSLSEALRYVQFKDGSITLAVVASCRLEGDGKATPYYVPDYARMVVTYRDDQTDAIGEKAAYSEVLNRKRYEQVRLEVCDSVRLVVEGMLEVSALLQDEGGVTGSVSGEYGYGHMHLAPTASVSLTNGARMQAWGYVTGSGMVTVNAGATVREAVQFGDWKGGAVSYEMLNNPQRVFPITHFFYQNIECPVLYLPGSRAMGSTYVKVSTFPISYDDIRLVDHQPGALFVMGDDKGFIRKEYDPVTDRTDWTICGDVSLDQFSITTDNPFAAGLNLLSANYVLPIGCNTTIRALSGAVHILHDMAMLPGAVLEIADSAELHIPDKARLYLYDRDRWGRFADKLTPLVTYSPTWDTCPRDTLLTSARMRVGGTVRVEGALYTTEGGADIVGCDTSEGQVLLVNGAAAGSVVYQLTGTNAEHQYTPQTALSAALRNADSTLIPTVNAPVGERFFYTQGRWVPEKGTNPDTIPVDTIPVDTIPVDTIPIDTIPVDTMPRMALTQPAALSCGRLVWYNGGLYIITREGSMYTLLGLPVKKEEW